MKNETSVTEFILNELKSSQKIFTYSGSNWSVFRDIYPDMQTTHLSLAKKQQNLTDDEEVLWLHYRLPNDNLIITKTSLYIKQLFDKQRIIKWKKLVKVEYVGLEKSYYFFFSKTNKNNYIKINESTIHFDKKHIPEFLKLFNSIAKFVKTSNSEELDENPKTFSTAKDFILYELNENPPVFTNDTKYC